MTDFLPKLSSPNDWPDSWKDLQIIDSLLRCSICGEFFKSTTFIPDCSHNYCSLCIRRYLCTDSKCPSCGVSAKDTQLKNNRILDEIVKSFCKIRDKLLKVIKDSCTEASNSQDEKLKGSKGIQKKEVNRSRFFSLKSPQKKPVASRSSKSSQKRRRKPSSSSSDKTSSDDTWSPVDRKKLKRSNFGDDDNTTESDEVSIIENPTPKKSSASLRIEKEDDNRSKNKDLVDCPVCGKKMAQTKINSHLDTCLTSQEKKSNLRSSPAKQDQKTSERPSLVGANSYIPRVAAKKPLKKLVYTLLSNADLKRKMKEHGLSIKGDRQTLVKRHQEFTIMYNSECSKPRPKPVAEIVRLVEEGERKKSKPGENREKLNFDRGQTQKDIDKMKDEYVSQNQNEFTRLINEIRNRPAKQGRSSGNVAKSSTSKTEDPPSTSKHKRLASQLLASDDDTTSNSSGADFEPVQKRYTPRREVKSSGMRERRQTRSCVRKLEQNIEDDVCDETSDTTAGDAEILVHEDLVDPMESCVPTSNLPDPPSASLLDRIDEKESSAESSESESMLRPAFELSSSAINTVTKRALHESPDDYESEEIEF